MNFTVPDICDDFLPELQVMEPLFKEFGASEKFYGEILKTIDLGVRALNCHPLKSNKRNEGQLNIAIRFAGVGFEPGQYLYADENGMVVANTRLELNTIP